MAQSFYCPYCVKDDFTAPSEVLLLTNIRVVHSLDPNFTIQCSVNGCNRTFKNFRTYQNHRLTHRPTVSTHSDLPDSDFDGHLDGGENVSDEDLEPAVALHLPSSSDVHMRQSGFLKRMK